jgi:hypothetical protein
MSNFFFTGTAADKIPLFAAVNAIFPHPVGIFRSKILVLGIQNNCN